MKPFRLIHHVICALLSAAASLAAGQACADITLYGPIPYTSVEDTPAGFASGSMVLEDFEDGTVNPRLAMSAGSVIGPGGLTDSVDADDGSIDGSGTNGHSFFTSPPLTITFQAPFPTSAGLVWTDGGFGAAVTFEAFDPMGESLGSIGPIVIGDNNNAGSTAEDRFYGVHASDGVASIRISHDSGGLEIDHVHFSAGPSVEPAIMSTLEDGSLGVLLRTPATYLPIPKISQLAVQPARPHGLAFLGSGEAIFSDFVNPQLIKVSTGPGGKGVAVPMLHRNNGNGSLATDPNGRYAISVGERGDGIGEAVVLDFAEDPPLETVIAGGLRVLSFVTAAIDFDPEGRAFVCHTHGVSVLSRPYTSIDFTMPFPPAVQSPSMCRLTRDGQRLFVTRMLSETQPSINGVRTTTAPFSAGSVFSVMPAPADVQGLGPMAISPDGQALIVGQQFLFPPLFQGQRARVFLLRAPFDGSTNYQELSLPAAVVGLNCSDEGQVSDCPGFEHIEVSAHGSLAILTGNSGADVSGASDEVPAVFLQDPFDDALRTAFAVQISDGALSAGRGAGGARFQPYRVFNDGLEE